MRRRTKLRCSCDTVGSGVCQDCRAIVSRRLDAAGHATESTEPADQIVKPLESPVPNTTTDARRSDVSARLRSAATLVADREWPLEAIIDLVTGTLRRLQRLAAEEREYAPQEFTAHDMQGGS